MEKLEEEKNKTPHGLAKKICVTNKWIRNSSAVFEEISSRFLKCSQDKAGTLVAFPRSARADIEKIPPRFLHASFNRVITILFLGP